MSETTRAPVLVLNQNYQPLNICDIRRAVKLVGKGKAQSVQDSGEYIYTVSDIFERPDVIRLVYIRYRAERCPATRSSPVITTPASTAVRRPGI